MPMSALTEMRAELTELSDPQRALHSLRFFKTRPGEYGEGDVFAGITVPDVRRVAKRYWPVLELPDVERLLHSKVHEERLAALVVLVHKFNKGNDATRRQIFDLYVSNTRYVNNWDLVDSSADRIVGEYLHGRDKALLDDFARSSSLWERRISIIATFNYIRRNEFEDTFRIAETLLHDPHDLIHKAVGWMLREVGKRDLAAVNDFLDAHCVEMPRTMLRYAIERHDAASRAGYLAGTPLT